MHAYALAVKANQDDGRIAQKGGRARRKTGKIFPFFSMWLKPRRNSLPTFSPVAGDTARKEREREREKMRRARISSLPRRAESSRSPTHAVGVLRHRHDVKGAHCFQRSHQADADKAGLRARATSRKIVHASASAEKICSRVEMIIAGEGSSPLLPSFPHVSQESSNALPVCTDTSC